MSGIRKIASPVLTATLTTDIDQLHNTEHAYTVAVAGVLASQAPTLSIRHSLPDGASALGSVQSDGAVIVTVLNFSGQTIPAGQVITINARQ